MDVELALKLSAKVHDLCNAHGDVPHDIGITLEAIVQAHQDEKKPNQWWVELEPCGTKEFDLKGPFASQGAATKAAKKHEFGSAVVETKHLGKWAGKYRNIPNEKKLRWILVRRTERE